MRYLESTFNLYWNTCLAKYFNIGIVGIIEDHRKDSHTVPVPESFNQLMIPLNDHLHLMFSYAE